MLDPNIIGIGINYEDNPATTKEFWGDAKIFMPQHKVHISPRLDEDIINYFREEGKGYQSRINAILKAYIKISNIRNASMHTLPLCQYSISIFYVHYAYVLKLNIHHHLCTQQIDIGIRMSFCCCERDWASNINRYFPYKYMAIDEIKRNSLIHLIA